MIRPGSLLRRSFAGLGADPNDRAYLKVAVPAGKAVLIDVGWSGLVMSGAERITRQRLSTAAASPIVADPWTKCWRAELLARLLRPGPDVSFGRARLVHLGPGAVRFRGA
jgi:hypothetical protein